MERSDCPACGGKFERRHHGYRELVAGYEFRGNLQSIASQLVSARTGLVVSCEPIMEEDADPGWPHLYAARLSNHRFGHQLDDRAVMTTGKGLSAADAFLSALGEIIERYAASVWRAEEIRYSRRGDLDSAFARPARPCSLYGRTVRPRPIRALHGRCRARLDFRPFAGTGRANPCAGHCTFFDYRAQRPDEHLCGATSSGLAVAPSLIEAILTAAFEVIERDAYMIAWFNRLAGQAVRVHDHPDDAIVHMARLLQRRGVELRLFRLPTDQPCHVFLALGLGSDANGPAAVVALGADPDPAAAARKAVLELEQVRPDCAADCVTSGTPASCGPSGHPAPATSDGPQLALCQSPDAPGPGLPAEAEPDVLRLVAREPGCTGRTSCVATGLAVGKPHGSYLREHYAT